MRSRLFAAAAVICASMLLAVSAATGKKMRHDPPLQTSATELKAALHCTGKLRKAKHEPVLLVHGTGGGGADAWAGAWEETVNFVQVLRRAGYPTCYVELPQYALGDVQVSAEYVVAAIRTMNKRAGRPIALYGHSQGGLLLRWVLTYWPSLRPKVADALGIAATFHGTDWASLHVFVTASCQPSVGCPPAFWQQTIGSMLLSALNNGRDGTPGRSTAWTTVRTIADDIVQPQTGNQPTSALRGAKNIAVQDVCPGRSTNHFVVPFDSVSYAALIDALKHKGPAKPRRFRAGVCSLPFAPGIDESQIKAYDTQARSVVAQRAVSYSPQATAEPPVRTYASR